jgi:arsenate reductase-like glutaredoxin family protein
MKKTSVDKFLYGSNMSESEKIKMWQDQHAFEIKNTFGMTPDKLQSKMNDEAVQKVMKCVKGHLEYISKDRDSIIRNKKQLEKPDLTEEDKIKLTNENSILEKRKVLECKQTEEYLDRHINEKYGSSDVNVHTKDNINTFEEVKGWFMDPPQGMCAGLQLTGDNYPPDLMERDINEY